MNGPRDDIRLPFSTIDPVVGDVLSVLWEPDMMGDTGNALKILTSEVLTQAGQQVLAATVMTALMSALQWPMSESRIPLSFPCLLSDTDRRIRDSAHEVVLLD